MLQEQSDTEHLFIFLSGNREVSTHTCSKIWLLLPTVTQQLSCYSSTPVRGVLLILHQPRISFQACLPHPFLFYLACLRAGGTEPHSRVQKKPQMGGVFIAVFTLGDNGQVLDRNDKILKITC